jgi:transposase
LAESHAAVDDEGEDGLGDHRKTPHWRASPPHAHTRLSTPAHLEELRTALLRPAPQEDGWNSRRVAAWLSARVGRGVSQDAALSSLHLLDFTPQTPRPRHTKAASPEERATGKQSWKPREGR